MAFRLADRDLVIAYQAGDDEAFAELVREYRPQLIGHARRRLRCPDAAEDAVQEALARALRAMPRFNGNYRVGPWLHRILSNVCADEGNRRRRDDEKTERYRSNGEALNTPPTVEGQLGLDLDNSELAGAVEGLSEQYREALMLRFVDELSYEEIAETAGISEDNARARVSRARNAVRSALRLAAAAPVALVGLLRRGERAASALSSSAPGAAAGSAAAGSTAAGTAVAGAALSGSATAGAATAGAALTGGAVAGSAAAGTAVAGAAATGTAVVGVPMIAKAAVGLGLATAVVAPTVDSPVHRAAERVLPDSVVEVFTPLAVEAPAPDAPVVVPPAAAPDPRAELLAVVAASRQASADITGDGAAVAGSSAASAVASSADVSAAATPSVGPSPAAADPADAEAVIIARSTEQSPTAVAGGSAAPAGAAPAVTSVSSGSIDGGELAFTPAGAGRYDVSGALVLTVTTTSEAGEADGQPGDTTVSVSTTDEPLNLLTPSSASLTAADPADPTAQQRFSALLVIDAGNGETVEMRLAARGTAADSSLPLEGLFTATQSDALPLAQRGSMSGTLVLSGDGELRSLSLTLGP